MAKKKSKSSAEKPVKKLAKKQKKLSKRVYNNETRLQKSEQSQKKIMQAVVEFLVERRGGEVNMAEVSKRSKISVRTIFRFFKDKQAMNEATDRYLQSFLKAGMDTLQELNIEGFAKHTFELFEKHEDLVMAYLFSPFGQQARDIFRKKVKQVMIQKIMIDSKLNLSASQAARLQLIVSLVNARLWHEIKQDSKLTSSEIGEAASWAIKTLLKNLDD